MVGWFILAAPKTAFNDALKRERGKVGASTKIERARKVFFCFVFNAEYNFHVRAVKAAHFFG